MAQLVELTARRPGGPAASRRPGTRPSAPSSEPCSPPDGCSCWPTASRVTVAAPDRPGLLATVAGVLTLARVTVRSATTMSDAATGMALLRFEVAPAFDDCPTGTGCGTTWRPPSTDGSPCRRWLAGARTALRPLPAGLGGGRATRRPGHRSTTSPRPRPPSSRCGPPTAARCSTRSPRALAGTRR